MPPRWGAWNGVQMRQVSWDCILMISKIMNSNTPVGSWTLCRSFLFCFVLLILMARILDEAITYFMVGIHFMWSNITLHFFVKFVCVCVYVHGRVNFCIKICECRPVSLNWMCHCIILYFPHLFLSCFAMLCRSKENAKEINMEKRGKKKLAVLLAYSRIWVETILMIVLLPQQLGMQSLYLVLNIS